MYDMDLNSLQKLKKSLPTNSIKSLAQKCSVSEDLIRKVLSGKRNNENVIDEAILLAADYKLKKDKRLEAISSL